MRIAQINMRVNGSTGNIMFQIAQSARQNGYIVRTYAPVIYLRDKKTRFDYIHNHFWWGNKIESFFHYYVGTLLGLNGFFSIYGTWQLIRDLKKYSPDIIHLHNLHGFCVNLPMLFRYIKKKNINVVWTLHDCWTFTGHCAHFTMVKCDKWKTGCGGCQQLNVYPQTRIDNTKYAYKLKKKRFTSVENMVLVTPSQWLADLVKQSFLKDYMVKVIHNGIDLSVFKPMSSSFRRKYHIPDSKSVLLGVADDWGKRKGLDIFVELSKRLAPDEYQIVLVGTNNKIDASLPGNIISIHRTENRQELAEIYSAADLFVNPTREENYPTVNMEAIACGTPVLTFKTGGSPEILNEQTGGVVNCDDVEAMEQEIIRICKNKPYASGDCIEHAKMFDITEKFEEYLKLYEDCAHSAERTV